MDATARRVGWAPRQNGTTETTETTKTTETVADSEVSAVPPVASGRGHTECAPYQINHINRNESKGGRCLSIARLPNLSPRRFSEWCSGSPS